MLITHDGMRHELPAAREPRPHKATTTGHRGDRDPRFELWDALARYLVSILLYLQVLLTMLACEVHLIACVARRLLARVARTG